MAAERDQGECEQRFRLVAGASLDGFWDFDVTGNVAHYSPRWQAIADFEPYELAGDLVHWLERVHPGDRPRFEAELKALSLRKSKRMRKEHPLRDQHGSWRWVAVRGVAEFDTSQNEPTGAVTALRGRLPPDRA